MYKSSSLALTLMSAFSLNSWANTACPTSIDAVAETITEYTTIIGLDGASISATKTDVDSTNYADLAEKYVGDKAYEPGTVVVFGGDEEITACTIKGDRKVAGVVSTNPAYLMNNELEGDTVLPLALTWQERQNQTPNKAKPQIYEFYIQIQVN